MHRTVKDRGLDHSLTDFPVAQTHMTFGKEFTQAVEQKQIAQQGQSPPLCPSTAVLIFPRHCRGRARQVHRRARRSRDLPSPLASPDIWSSLQSEQERQASVVRAEGEAEAAIIISKALNKAGEGLVQFRRIEASKDIAGTLANVSTAS